MCGKNLNPFCLVFSLLFFLSLPLASYSEALPSPAPSPSSVSEINQFLQAAAIILKQYPQAKPQLQQMQKALETMSLRSQERQLQLEMQVTALQTQVTELQNQQTNLANSQAASEASWTSLVALLRNQINSLTADLAARTTERDLSLIGNGLQAVFAISLEGWHYANRPLK